MMNNDNEIKVSVLVTVYNHEKYLSECLSSIVNQKTNFRYEILVHDDCSTDNSKEIIEKFYRDYPEIVVPIYQKENLYSKGIKITQNILIPRVKGKYFCFCEGDDFWIDDNKLQKQYDFLERNPEYKFCVHNSLIVDRNDKIIGKIIALKNGGDLTCEDFIRGGGEFVATNSIFSYTYLAKKLPNYFNYMSLDYTWQIYLSSVGKTYCFKDMMSSYRFQSNNSWSVRMNNDLTSHINHVDKVMNCLEKINEETNYQFDKVICDVILKGRFRILELKRDYKAMREEPYKEIWKSQPIKKKIKFFLDEHFPRLYKIIYKLLKK